MDAAAKTGDPNAVKEASNRVTEVQHNGFMRNAELGNAYLQRGFVDKAKRYFDRAYQFAPDGNRAEFSTTVDDKGNPSVVIKSYDEKTGEFAGAMVLNPDTAQKLLNNFRNPAAFASWNQEGKYKALLNKAKAEQAFATADYYGGGGPSGKSGQGGGLSTNQRLQRLKDAREMEAEAHDRLQALGDRNDENGAEWDYQHERFKQAQALVQALGSPVGSQPNSGGQGGQGGGRVPTAKELADLEQQAGSVTDADRAKFQRLFPGQPLPKGWEPKAAPAAAATTTAEPALPEPTYEPEKDIEARKQAVKAQRAEALAKEKTAAGREKIKQQIIYNAMAGTFANKTDVNAALQELKVLMQTPVVKNDPELLKEAQKSYKKLLRRASNR